MMKLKVFWKKCRAYLLVSAVLVTGTCCLLFCARPEEEVQPDIVITGSVNDTESERTESQESVEDRDEGITVETSEADGSENILISELIAMGDAIVEEPEEKRSEESTEETAQIVSVMEENRGFVSESAPESTKALEAVSEQIPVSMPVPESTETPEPEDTPTSVPVFTPTLDPEVVQKSCVHNWIFTSYYQEPTCGNGGLENQVCAVCGETQTTSGTPTGKHNFVVETPGDCCREEQVRCEACNHREVRGKDSDNHMDVEDGFCYGCGQEVKDSE